MPYLNLDPNYFDHPKTRRLIGILGPMADVMPLRLWAYCAKFHPQDGRMKGYGAGEIEAIIQWHGVSGAAISALVKVGYLLESAEAFSCVDWKQHEGHLAAFSRRGKAAARARWNKYASSMPQELPLHRSSNAPAVPILTIPNLAEPTKERKVRAAARFVPPSIEEVKTYCAERKTAGHSEVNPQKWHNYYSSNGWRVGRNPMKDWRAAVRTWEKNDYGNQGSQGGRGGGAGSGGARVVGAAAPAPGKYDHLG